MPIKIKFTEHTRAWLLNSSCSDVLLATQEYKPSLFLRFYDTSLHCVVLMSYCEPTLSLVMGLTIFKHYGSAAWCLG